MLGVDVANRVLKLCKPIVQPRQVLLGANYIADHQGTTRELTRSGNEKDQADEFERELMQPRAQALRTRLGDAGEVHVNNEPRLMTGERVEYATWLEVVLNDARTEVIFRPLSREDFSAIWQWGKSGRFIFPISQGGANAGDSARASIDAVAERICQTASMWHEEPPESFGWSAA